MDTNTKILVVASGWSDGASEVNDGKFEGFSDKYKHYLAIRTSNPDCRELERPGYKMLGFYQPRWMRPYSRLSRCVFVFSTLLFFGVLKRNSPKLDLIVARDPLSSGIVCLILGRLLGLPLLVELNGNFASSELWERPNRRVKKAKRYIGTRLARFVLARATTVKQLYPGQLEQLTKFRTATQAYSFHNYVTTSNTCNASTSEKKYLIMMGSPWHIKGFDIAVDAYLKVLERNDNYPYDLFIVGYIRPKELVEFKKVCDFDSPRIHLLKPVSYEKAQVLLSEAIAIVVASRTEGMPRVLIESMRLGTLCVASNVDGIPFYLENNKTGLLFDQENSGQLADLLEQIGLHDFGEITDLAQRTAIHRYSTAEYVRQYQEMIDTTIKIQTKVRKPIKVVE